METAGKRLLTTEDHDRASAGMRYVYPVVSRRAGGVSVGINLNPNNACNWRCIYCQVPDLRRGSAPPVDLERLERELRVFLGDIAGGDFMTRRVAEPMRRVADVALSGNGEPTSAAEFAEVIELVGRVLADFGLGDIVVRVITNGSLVRRERVQDGLRRLSALGGEVWFKVDAGTAERIRLINDVSLTPAQVSRNLRLCAELCPTWVQTCVFAIDGRGPTAEDTEAYVNLLRESGPERLKGVHLYSLARRPQQAEAGKLSRLQLKDMEMIAGRIREVLGLTVTVNP